MAIDIEGFESAVLLVCNAHEDLRKVNGTSLDNILLSLI